MQRNKYSVAFFRDESCLQSIVQPSFQTSFQTPLQMEAMQIALGLWTLLLAGLLAVFVQMLRIMKSMHKEMKRMGRGGELAQTMQTMVHNAKTYYVAEHGERVHWRRSCPGLNAARHVRELKSCDMCCP